MAVNWGSMMLERDLRDEKSKLSQDASRLASAKKGGAGIGGLLGSIAGPALGAVLAPFTGGASLALLSNPMVMGALGGGLGSLAGSKIAGKGKEIEGGNFLKGSRGQIDKDIAGSELGDVLSGAASGALSGFKAGGNTFGAAKEGSKFANFQDALTTVNTPGGPASFNPSNILDLNYGDAIKGWGEETMKSFLPGEVTGDASLTPVPGLEMDENSNLLTTAMENANPMDAVDTIPLATGDNPMSITMDNMYDFAGDWQTLPDGRQFSPSLNQYIN